MAQRTAKPADIKTLQDWVKRWPKVSNLSFDPETREASIYKPDDIKTKTGSIPWKREADVITVLSDPSRFSEAAVTASKKRMGTIRQTTEQTRRAVDDQMRTQESALLEAWREYRSAPSSALMAAVIQAELALNATEKSLASKERAVYQMGDFITTYDPPIPNNQRGLGQIQ
jgi:hypothetical protein